MFSTRGGAAKLALGVIIGLVVLKVVVAVITGSLSILAQAADSFLDLFAVGVTFFALSIASLFWHRCQDITSPIELATGKTSFLAGNMSVGKSAEKADRHRAGEILRRVWHLLTLGASLLFPLHKTGWQII